MWILQGHDSKTGRASEHPRFRVPPGAIKTVGRAQRADLIVDAALVSRLHCRLEAGQDVIEVYDLSSTNGTYVNDKRVKRGTLKAGDRLRVGRIELILERSD